MRAFFFLNNIVHIVTLFFLSVRQFLNQKGFSDKSTEIYGTTSSPQHSPNFVLYGHIKMNAYFPKYYSLRRLCTRMVVIQNITENQQRLKCQNSITTPICKYYLLLGQFFAILLDKTWIRENGFEIRFYPGQLEIKLKTFCV